ncbi:hypothetical protein O181_087996 [Austropuccinia psidii MF-1]|uniref:Uncharacterized protein n=1 Tax=Austropuccinia psidii MF-1 TaxID=1389203 RepID=A0A9Q3IQR0_9BASI|nr:hypothetical protein [Austropuccinia psidii MF-1]
MYGIDLNKNKDRYFTIGETNHQRFSFLPFKRQIKVRKVSPESLELEKFKSEQLNEAEKIQISLTQISQVVYISTMDALKGFNQNVVTPRERKNSRVIVHCGVYEHFRMPLVSRMHLNTSKE